MHWAVRNDLFLFLYASSWLPYSTVGWLVFNVKKLHFLQSVSLEQYSIFARKIIKKLSYSASFISIIIYIFLKKSKQTQPASQTITSVHFYFYHNLHIPQKYQNKPSLRQSDHNNKRSEDNDQPTLTLFLQDYI